MPGVVFRLPAALANQIAAGEVVERPASAVKELIENSLDAGATRIEVAIDDGGLGSISVTDDGRGMTPEDAVLALERHATSKIRVFDDLVSIGTFGFRGEALPSIASVSRFRLTTRQAGEKSGIAVTVSETGEVRSQPAGCAEGTRVEARDLFFNVPARRKFLKSVATETAHVNDVVRSAALSRHDVTFVMRRDGKVTREYLRAASRHERAIGLAQGEPLIPIRFARGPLTVEAYLAPPERARAGSGHLDILVNRRPVRDLRLARAVAQAFGPQLAAGRYPYGIVYLDLPAPEVDVNVHPQKSEVRFADSVAVYEALRFALERELGTSFPSNRSRPAIGSFVVSREPERTRIADSAAAPLLTPRAPAVATKPLASERSARSALVSPPGPVSFSTQPAPAPPVLVPATRSVFDPDEPSLFKSVRFYAGLRYVGQLRDAHLLCEGADGLYVLDQHAVAERLTLHRLRAGHLARSLRPAPLAAAESVPLSAGQIAALEAAEPELLRLGIELHAVSGGSVSIAGLPSLLQSQDPRLLVTELANEIARSTSPFDTGLPSLLAVLACQGSLRPGRTVEPAEVESMLAALDDVDFSLPCTHGRPVSYRLGFDDIDRKAHR